MHDGLGECSESFLETTFVGRLVTKVTKRVRRTTLDCFPAGGDPLAPPSTSCWMWLVNAGICSWREYTIRRCLQRLEPFPRVGRTICKWGGRATGISRRNYILKDRGRATGGLEKQGVHQTPHCRAGPLICVHSPSASGSSVWSKKRGRILPRSVSDISSILTCTAVTRQ